MDVQNSGFSTKLVHAGAFHDQFGSATVPIYQSSTFIFDNAEQGADRFAGKADGYIYSRIGNPTISALEQNIAALENGYGGIAASSGMGAINSIYFALLNQGDHILGTNAVYGPSRGVLENHYTRFGVESTFVDTTKLDEVRKSIRPNTKMLYLETPSNPTMEITDIKACAAIAREHNLILVVDNTFASPYLQNPLDLGADVVVHSITKFINGHADVVGGVIVTKTKELYAKIRHMMVTLGCNMDPHQAFLVIRGVKTLGLRMERSQASTMMVAKYLQSNPKVSWIRYPGLETDPGHKIAKEQMRGFGAMICFGVKDGLEAGRTLMNSVKLIGLAVSLGGVESLIEHPASMTHVGIPAEEKIKSGITDDLVRLSIGIEDVEDILADLEHAFSKI